MTLPFFVHVANDQVEKLLRIALLKFDIEYHIYAKHFVVKEELRGPIISLHFMRHNSVVIDTTRGLIHFQQMTMQVKIVPSKKSARPKVVLNHDALTVPK